MHDDPEWRAFWQSALEDAGYHLAVSDHLPDEQDLARHDLVVMSLPIALARLPQLLQRSQHNLVITMPLEGFGSSREWQVYKLERVGATVVDTPASASALTEFIEDHLALSAP